MNPHVTARIATAERVVSDDLEPIAHRRPRRIAGWRVVREAVRQSPLVELIESVLEAGVGL
jgi:hypothetical protein